jgi:peptidoglycan/xylan/chitin deacetylase (PgdA/CDA1 family)
MMKKTLRSLSWLSLGVLGLFLILFMLLPLPGDIPVLMYHFIDTPERAAVEKNVVSRESFEGQMRFLKTFGYRVLTLEEYYAIKTGTRAPRGREIVITFDDGNYTFADQAFPILQAHALPSAMFVISENMKQQSEGSMGIDTLRSLQASGLVTLGSHTKTHRKLSELPFEAAAEELRGAKVELEQIFGRPMDYLAYPSGAINQEVLTMAEQAGYKLAFTTSPQKLGELPEGFYSLTRVKISRTSDLMPAFWFKISGLYETCKRVKKGFLFRG